ncbi:response regulator [Novipirellula artificiosorum]|uniref:Chemotaxis protein CheY n=1 Tax=Novipirellula artificiosorum TaxID=2528016 RepID=A0A5C6D504_9BACT|nr:response regulator [Novipirellula artificiosorum]TWU31145.1 Chemotaxis protein CheY [Novipirellula artificiosorum]
MPNSAPPKRCVIADDVRASREIVGKWRRACGFECRVAENGQVAWELIKEQPSDLLVTDLEMPELCGLELLEKTRQAGDESIRKMPVLVMTSLHDGQTLNIVQRACHPTDSRAKIVSLTTAGKRKLRKLWKCRQTIRDDMQGCMTPDQADTLIPLHQNIASTLNQEKFLILGSIPHKKPLHVATSQ